MSEKRYWLMKSEPNAYSFTDLMNEEEGAAEWDGVRNYQARNTMRDDMKVGDGVIFYHSNAKPPGAVGIAEIVREGYRTSPHGTRVRAPGPQEHAGQPDLVHGGHQGSRRVQALRPLARNQGDSRTRKHASGQELSPVRQPVSKKSGTSSLPSACRNNPVPLDGLKG